MMMIGQQERVVVGPTEAHHCVRCQTETGFAELACTATASACR